MTTVGEQYNNKQHNEPPLTQRESVSGNTAGN